MYVTVKLKNKNAICSWWSIDGLKHIIGMLWNFWCNYICPWFAWKMLILLSSNGVKWWSGPKGNGILHIRSSEYISLKCRMWVAVTIIITYLNKITCVLSRKLKRIYKWRHALEVISGEKTHIDWQMVIFVEKFWLPQFYFSVFANSVICKRIWLMGVISMTCKTCK